MRKNLTISLAPKEWSALQALSKELSLTYSGVIQRLITEIWQEAKVDHKKVKKYRSVFEPHAEYFAQKAKRLTKASRLGKP